MTASCKEPFRPSGGIWSWSDWRRLQHDGTANTRVSVGNSPLEFWQKENNSWWFSHFCPTCQLILWRGSKQFFSCHVLVSTGLRGKQLDILTLSGATEKKSQGTTQKTIWFNPFFEYYGLCQISWQSIQWFLFHLGPEFRTEGHQSHIADLQFW